MTYQTKTEDVGNEVERRLKLILVANGFETDIGATVFRGRRKKVVEDEYPCTVMLEGADEIIKQLESEEPAVALNQPFVMEAYGPCDPLHPNDAAHAMIRDLKKALYSDGAELGGIIKKLLYLGRDIGAREDGQKTVMVQMAVKAFFVEQLRVK